MLYEKLMQKSREYSMKDSIEHDFTSAQILRVAERLEPSLKDRIEEEKYIFHLPHLEYQYEDLDKVIELMRKENAYSQEECHKLASIVAKNDLIDAHFKSSN
jgi:predicted GTPase